MFYDGGYQMGGVHGLWRIVWLVMIGLVVLYVWGRPGARRGASRESPLDVLKQRLAGGEISPDDYEKRKALLERDGARR
jgi:putative membrane protein